MRLRWTPPARDHLAEIHDYIAQDNPAAARRVIGQVRKDADLLKDNPGMGRPGRVEGTRELVVSRLTLHHRLSHRRTRRSSYRRRDSYGEALA